MTTPCPCQWRHAAPERILRGARWLLHDTLHGRDIKEFLVQRRLSVDHTTVCHSVQRHVPEIERGTHRAVIAAWCGMTVCTRSPKEVREPPSSVCSVLLKRDDSSP